jgi:hypothetical protein
MVILSSFTIDSIPTLLSWANYDILLKSGTKIVCSLDLILNDLWLPMSQLDPTQKNASCDIIDIDGEPIKLKPPLPLSQIAVVCFFNAMLTPLFYFKWTAHSTPLTHNGLICLMISAICAITLGHISLYQFKHAPNTKRGEGFTTLGIMTAYITIIILILIEIFFVF